MAKRQTRKSIPGAKGPDPLTMSLSLNVLNHLGLNLYSNVPAVLSEVVANAWDADAENVTIEINTERGKVILTDDGHGMSRSDVNQKFLMVGYQRREHPGGAVTPTHKRQVMGRKGIGKLSLLGLRKQTNGVRGQIGSRLSTFRSVA